LQTFVRSPLPKIARFQVRGNVMDVQD
jgi:hypothetical protein